MTLFELHSTSTVYMDGSAIWHVKRKGKAGIVCSLRIPAGEEERIEALLLLQAEAAWEAGRIAGSSSTVQPNPYTALENNK